MGIEGGDSRGASGTRVVKVVAVAAGPKRADGQEPIIPTVKARVVHPPAGRPAGGPQVAKVTVLPKEQPKVVVPEPITWRSGKGHTQPTQGGTTSWALGPLPPPSLTAEVARSNMRDYMTWMQNGRRRRRSSSTSSSGHKKSKKKKEKKEKRRRKEEGGEGDPLEKLKKALGGGAAAAPRPPEALPTPPVDELLTTRPDHPGEGWDVADDPRVTHMKVTGADSAEYEGMEAAGDPLQQLKRALQGESVGSPRASSEAMAARDPLEELKMALAQWPQTSEPAEAAQVRGLHPEPIANPPLPTTAAYF
eukprot:Hpha_TRINITY_DN3770_c0_g1::TRINITY_DN3770_c0_g1_i1::g.23777::m.23777